MRSFGIIEAVNVAAKRGAGFGNIGIGSQVNPLIFDCSPKTLDDDEDIVSPRPLAIHADGDLVLWWCLLLQHLVDLCRIKRKR